MKSNPFKQIVSSRSTKGGKTLAKLSCGHEMVIDPNVRGREDTKGFDDVVMCLLCYDKSNQPKELNVGDWEKKYMDSVAKLHGLIDAKLESLSKGETLPAQDLRILGVTLADLHAFEGFMKMGEGDYDFEME